MIVRCMDDLLQESSMLAARQTRTGYGPCLNDCSFSADVKESGVQRGGVADRSRSGCRGNA